MDKKTLSEYIRRNELDAFFKAATQMKNAGEAWQNELILLERRFVELEDQEGDGVLSPEEASRLRNGISRDAMKLLEELGAFQPLHPASQNVRKLKKSTLWLLLGAGMLVALLVWQFRLSKEKNRKTEQETTIVKPAENSGKSNPEIENQTDPQTKVAPDKKTTPETTQKRLPSAPEQISKSGVALKVSGNNDEFDAEIASFLEKVLLEKGIATYPVEKGGSYAAAIDCRFSVNETRTRTRDGQDVLKSVIILSLTARNSDNVVCYTKRFTSNAQIMRPGDAANEAIKKGLKSLREAIKASGIQACAD
ncbi:MAG: hypothetical protein HUU01_05945 [Saprospiraceae bacterium]|nr:hypothetical protein [Saprospiraceae bacterium]